MRALVAAMLLVPALGQAAPRRWAIGEIRVEGPLAPAERHDVEERAWKTLALLLPSDATLAPDDAVERALAEQPELRGCGEDRCNLALGDRLGVERLLTLRIELRDGSWTARLLDYAVDAAQVAGTLELPCRGCDAIALLDALGRAFGPLLETDGARALCALSVSAQPPAGMVSVDAVPLGRAPFAHTIAAGRHTITVAAEHRVAAQAEIDCPAGGRQQLVLALAAEPGVASAPHGRRLLLAVGAASLAVGGAAIAGMGVAGAYDGRAACDGPRCAFRYDTTPSLAVAAVAVVVFGAAGAGLLAAGLRRGRF